MVLVTEYGEPFFIAGSNLIPRAAAIACSVKPFGRPLTGEIAPIVPLAWKVTRRTTLPWT